MQRLPVLAIDHTAVARETLAETGRRILDNEDAIVANGLLEDSGPGHPYSYVLDGLARTIKALDSPDPMRRALAVVEAGIIRGADPEELIEDVLAPAAPAHLRTPGVLLRLARGHLSRVERGAPLIGSIADDRVLRPNRRRRNHRLTTLRVEQFLGLLTENADLANFGNALAGVPSDDYLSLGIYGEPLARAAARARALPIVAAVLAFVQADDAERAAAFLEWAAEIAAAADLLSDYLDPRAAEPEQDRDWSDDPDPPPWRVYLTECVLTAAPPHPRARATALTAA